MKLFKVIPDEQLARFFWLQSITEWTWSANAPKSVNEEFNKVLTNFIKDNRQLLFNCRQLLRGDDMGAKLIWKIYSKEVDIYKSDKYETLKELDELFTPVFNVMWNARLANIIKWSEAVNNFFTKKHTEFIGNIRLFLQSDFKQTGSITVYPLLCSNLTISLMNKDYPDMILSQYDKCFKNETSANKALLHEYVHIMQHSSKSDDMLRQAFTTSRAIKALRHIRGAPSIAYAAREILVQSLVSTSLPSYYSTVFIGELKTQSKTPNNIPTIFKTGKNTYSDWYSHFRAIAYHSQDMLSTYMSSERSIDQEYCNNLAEITLGYLNGTLPTVLLRLGFKPGHER